jgi:hypothetical protein
MQIQLTGFLEKETAPFCKEMWNLFLSAQSSPQGVPQELLEAKKLELIQEKVCQPKASFQPPQTVLIHACSLQLRKPPRKLDYEETSKSEEIVKLATFETVSAEIGASVAVEATIGVAVDVAVVVPAAAAIEHMMIAEVDSGVAEIDHPRARAHLHDGVHIVATVIVMFLKAAAPPIEVDPVRDLSLLIRAALEAALVPAPVLAVMPVIVAADLVDLVALRVAEALREDRPPDFETVASVRDQEEAGMSTDRVIRDAETRPRP